jgi:uncharacterized protein (DUF2147 family)
MPARSALVAAVLLTVVASDAALAQSAGSPHGTWLTQAGDARVKVKGCGAALCGTIVWLREPIDPKTGKKQVDDKNPNPERASRPIVGLQIFANMRAAGPNKWSGHIYNADDGKTYESNVSVVGPSALKVEGCVGALCGSETWSRVGK